MREKILLTIIFLSFIFSLYIANQRINIEKKNKKVEIVLDYPSLLEFSGYNRENLFKVAEKFKQAGVVSIAVNEMNLMDLAREGRIYYTSGNFLLKRMLPLRQILLPRTYIFIEDKELYKMILDGLREKIGYEKIVGSHFGKFYIIEVAEALNKIEKIPIVIDFDLIRKLEKLGFFIVLRLKNTPYLNEENIDKIFKKIRFHKNCIKTLIFEGEEVLGYEKLLESVSRRIKEENLNFGFIEFAKQKGDRELALLSLPNVLKVHSIDIQEMKNISIQMCIQRYVRAVKERNVRICYLRLYPETSELYCLKLNLEYIKSIKDKLLENGYLTGAGENYDNFKKFEYLVFFIIAGLISSFLLLLEKISKSKFNLPFVFLLLFIISLLFYYKFPDFSLKIFSLICCILFPVTGFVIAYQEREIKEFFNRVLVSILKFLYVSFWTISGGFLISALLFDLKFLLQIDQFLGVKISHILPLISVYLIFSLNLLKENLQREKIENILERNILVRDILIFGIFLIAILISILRTGNEANFLVSEYELKIRSFLEKIFFARPRTKEFLIGHPSLILFFYLFFSNRKKYLTFFLLLGMFGQVSLINTFCHIHTPLLYSIIRSMNGIFVGIFLGIFLIILDKFLKGDKKWKENSA